MSDSDFDRWGAILGRNRADIKHRRRAASWSDVSRQLARNITLAEFQQLQIDPNDVFRVAPGSYDFGGDGPHLGAVDGNAGELNWLRSDVRTSALLLGMPNTGKSSTVMHLVLQLARDHTVVLPDLRGDYECLVRAIPNARLFSFGEFPLNLLCGPSRVPPSVFNQRFAEVITDMMDARQASRRYLELVLDELETKRIATGHWPCLPDLLAALEDRKEPRGSDELRFRNRCIARIDSIIRALGEKALAVEQGIDLEALIETDGVLIFRMNLERSVSDTLTNWLFTFVFEHRMWSEDKFNLKPLVDVLDEQRNILRLRRSFGGGEEVTGFESKITASRALGICCVIVEQVPSEICRAARVAPHLVIAFRTAGSELRTTTEILGLSDRRQAEALQSLCQGECIVVVGDDRGLPPLRVHIPKLALDRSNLTAEERAFHIKRSLADQLPRVNPRYEGYARGRQEVKDRERDPNRLSKNAYRDLVGIAAGPRTIAQLCRDLDLNTAEEGAARAECIRKGYVVEAGNVGWGLKLFELSPKGERFADEHNIPRRKYKSGVIHEFLLEKVREGLGAACPGLRWVNPAGVTGFVQPDAYGLFSGGQAICVQISWRNKLEYEVERLMELCSLAHLDMVLFVTPTKKKALSLELLIGQMWKAGIPRKYQLLSATDMLADGYDWASVLEREVDSGG